MQIDSRGARDKLRGSLSFLISKNIGSYCIPVGKSLVKLSLLQIRP